MALDSKNRSYGTGRRKTSVARLWYSAGSGNFIVNGKPIDEYFPNLQNRINAKIPLNLTDVSKYDIKCTVSGGGMTGQADAIKLGLSRALVEFHPDHYTVLRNNGCMTRDDRIVERKKYGHMKARKVTQFSKR